jgi:hypothetical protein
MEPSLAVGADLMLRLVLLRLELERARSRVFRHNDFDKKEGEVGQEKLTEKIFSSKKPTKSFDRSIFHFPFSTY